MNKTIAIATGVSVLLTGTLLAASLTAREGHAYDSEGGSITPLLCPPTLPTTDPNFQFNLLPMQFLVPTAT